MNAPVSPAPPPAPSKKLANVIAVTGCDGSGKSTLSADLLARLGQDGPVAFVYLGQSSGNIKRTIMALPLIGPPLGRWLAARAERAHERPKTGGGAGPSSSGPGPGAALVMFLLSLWRLYKFRRMLVLNQRGIVVVTDRYPQAETPGFFYDGTGLDVTQAKGWLVRTLARREQRFYQWMAAHAPTLVIRLNIDAETAHARKPDHKMTTLHQKLKVIPGLHFNGAAVLDLDSREPYADMLDAAMQAARKRLNHDGV